LTPPSAAGQYLSHAFLTPPGPTGAPDAGATAEAQFLDPIPHSLTVKAHYDAKSHAAVISGRVTELGKPQAGAVVDLQRADAFTPSKRVRTSANGTFTTHIRITATTTFAAGVPDTRERRRHRAGASR